MAAQAFDQKVALRESQAALGRTIGDYTLRDTEGRAVRLADLRGKPLVVNFVYTGCFQVCPVTTQFLAGAVTQAERTLGPGTFRVVTIGFNLPFDTPQAMKDFRRKHALESPHWLFLSPDAKTLPGLVADFGFRYESTAAGFDHLLQVSIVDAQGRIYRQVYGDLRHPLFVGRCRAGAERARAAGQPAGVLRQREAAVHGVRPRGGALPPELRHRRRAARRCERGLGHPRVPRRRAAAAPPVKRDVDVARRVAACAVGQCDAVVARSRSPIALSTFRTVAISGLPSGDRDL
jgi:cytochrome oxidase Cu insertion factor (SCO1/SenC/PrrC family)